MRHSIGRPIVQPGQEFEFVDGQFVGRNAEFMVELANGCILGTEDRSGGHIIRFVHLVGLHAMEGMRTARVGPDLLQKQGSIEKTNEVVFHFVSDIHREGVLRAGKQRRTHRPSHTTYIGKGDLRRGPLLQKQLAGRFVKQKDGKSTVEDRTGLVESKLVRRALGG